ncbi:MAG: hypothetical protein GF399_03950 [Candidatus Coatesbacteria bacterium]|nr:hypothetical protein [Candidatus Coatesbacteria bacterium]
MRSWPILLLLPILALGGTALRDDAESRGPGDPGVLLIADQTDGVADPLYFDDYYRDAIDDIFGHPYYYDHWVHSGEVSASLLAEYDAVIWYTGLSGGTSPADGPAGHITLTENEENAVVQYLSSTPADDYRGVWLSGMYIAWNCVADSSTQGQFFSTLFSQYVGLEYPLVNFTNPIYVDNTWSAGGGSSTPPLNGVPYSIFWAAGDYNYPDVLDTSGGSWSALTWRDSGGTDRGDCIIANEGVSAYGGTWRIVLSSLPLESIGTESSGEERMYVANDILDWFQVGLAVEPASWGAIKAEVR